MKLRKINKDGIMLEGVYQDGNNFQFDYNEDGTDHFIKLNSDINVTNIDGIKVYVGYEPSFENFKNDSMTHTQESINELEKILEHKKEILNNIKSELRDAKSVPNRNLFNKIKIHLKYLNTSYDSEKGQVLVNTMAGKNFDYEKMAENEEKISELEKQVEDQESDIKDIKSKLEPLRDKYSESSKDKKKLFSKLMSQFMKKLRRGGEEYNKFIEYSINKFTSSVQMNFDVIVAMDSSKFLTGIIAEEMSKHLNIPIIKPFEKIPANKINIDYDRILRELGEKEYNSLVNYIEKHQNKPVNISRLPSKVRSYVKYFESNDLNELQDKSVLAVDDIIYSGSTMAQMIDELEDHCKSLVGYVLFKI